MENTRISITLPNPRMFFVMLLAPFASLAKSIRHNSFHLLQELRWRPARPSIPRISFGRFLPNNFRPSRKLIRAILLIIAVVVIVVLGKGVIQGLSNVRIGDNRIELPGPRSEMGIGKDLEFPLKNDKGEQVSTIKFTLEKAELRSEIVVKGQRATAVKGRMFLIINLKITNNYDKAIEVDTRDYVRLSVNGREDEWLAPDIHNDPVEVRALSTKYTRVGFPINDSDKQLRLRVGELNGDKEMIELALN